MTIEHLAKVLGLVDATNESAPAAIARFAIHEMGGYDKYGRRPHVIEEDIARLADVLEAYALTLQTTGVAVNANEACHGEH